MYVGNSCLFFNEYEFVGLWMRQLNSSFLFLCRILNQVAKFFIETETHQWHVIFFIYIIYV